MKDLFPACTIKIFYDCKTSCDWWNHKCLSYKKSICFFGNVSPGWWEGLCLSVVSCESVDSGFNQNESEFTIDISSEFLDMLSDVDGFLDKMVKIFWDGGGDSSNLEDSEDL